MKNAIKLSLLFYTFTLLTVFQTLAQEQITTNKFAFRSVSISPVGLYAGNNSGVAFMGDVSFGYKANIFSLSLETGTEGNIIGRNEDHYQINLLYGREFIIKPKLMLEVYGGLGYFHNNFYKQEFETYKWREINQNTIGVPIGGKIRYHLGSRFSMGLILQVNINNSQTLGNLGLLLQWNAMGK